MPDLRPRTTASSSGPVAPKSVRRPVKPSPNRRPTDVGATRPWRGCSCPRLRVPALNSGRPSTSISTSACLPKPACLSLASLPSFRSFAVLACLPDLHALHGEYSAKAEGPRLSPRAFARKVNVRPTPAELSAADAGRPRPGRSTACRPWQARGQRSGPSLNP